MKEKLAFFVLYAPLLFLLTVVNCIKVIDNSENITTTTTTTTSTVKSLLESEIKSVEINASVSEARTIGDSDDDDKLPGFSLTTELPTNIHKIPPTLQNAKKLEGEKEKLEKSIKDIANNLKPAQIHNNQNILPDGKLKQAIIHSKQQSFKNLIDKSGKLKDQIARPAEVQSDISKEVPQKQFIPSPELSHLFTANNKMQDHFHPMNQYFRPQVTQQADARFPLENPFNTQQNDQIHPNDILTDILQQHGMLRHTNVEFPHHHQVERHVHRHRHHFNYENSYPSNNYGGSSERMIFPDTNPFSGEEIKFPPLPTKIPELNHHHQQQVKGSWKWIPENEEENLTVQPPEGRFQQFHTEHLIYHQPQLQRPQTVHDRPYQFESGDIFSHHRHHHQHQQQHSTPPTGPASSSSWPTTEALTTGEEMPTTSNGNESDKNHLDIKLLRSPSPWKKLIHVMTAAIPIGLIISALTPRIVYIHPNATAPTLQPPLSIQQQPPPFTGPQTIPQQQQQQQLNAPFPLRQRAVDDISTSLMEFMRFMEVQYRERHGEIDGACEDRFFCEMALMGTNPNADLMHKTLHKVAIETPKVQAEKSGLKEIFGAIKRQNCSIFKCRKLSHN